MPPSFLIVDDDADSTYLVRRNLELSFPESDIISCTSAAAAIELLKEHTFAVIVSDYRLGINSFDGITLAKQIRNDLHIKTPIIMRTCMDDIEGAAMAAGIDHVLPWFRWRELGEVTKSLLARSNRSQPAR